MAAAVPFSLVVWDVDGTLSDSLGPHMAFVHAMNETHGCGLALPAVGDLKGMRKTQGTPMRQFFINAGFPDHLLDVLVADYEDSFKRDFPVLPFDGAAALVLALQAHGIEQHVVSHNTVANIRAALGDELCAAFKSLHGVDTGVGDKADTLRAIVESSASTAEQAVYVGDTKSDMAAAASAGWSFIGAGYGFQLDAELHGEDGGPPIVSSIADVSALLLPRAEEAAVEAATE
eukprot:PLAT12458.4.p1 GENE.PLAT12458.4~~PLAT12458.4.p1  ORF type:complete len:232 (+),score=90.26 PLAT12458.4:45-740(+)